MVMRVALVVKKTRYETAGEEARDLLQKGDPSVSGWVGAHDRHYRSVEQVESALEKVGATVSRVKNPYVGFGVGTEDLVLVVGGDGTFLAASQRRQVDADAGRQQRPGVQPRVLLRDDGA
jgi:NAD kinase